MVNLGAWQFNKVSDSSKGRNPNVTQKIWQIIDRESNLLNLFTGAFNSNRGDQTSESETNKLHNESRICCVGIGFVGLYTSISFAYVGNEVIGIDIDQSLVDSINDGVAPIDLDIELSNYLKDMVEDDLISASSRITDASNCDVYVISVPTPLSDQNEPDLSYILAAARDIADVINRGDLVAIQSTVYPGCIRAEVIPELEQSGLEADEDFGVSYVPERYSPGDSKSYKTPRVVGSVSEDWGERTRDLYSEISNSIVPVSSIEVAETVKLLENVQRDVNIAYINEFTRLLNHIGINIWEVIEAADTKWNFHRYTPGMGVGGHCIPVDSRYLIKAARDEGFSPTLVSTARRVNDMMPTYHFKRLRDAMNRVGKSIVESQVCVLGVTYKPGVKDVRNSPAIDFIKNLEELTASINVYDPAFNSGEQISEIGRLNQKDPISAANDCDAMAIATNHNSFDSLTPREISKPMRENSVVLDPFRVIDSSEIGDIQLKFVRNIISEGNGFDVDKEVHVKRVND